MAEHSTQEIRDAFAELRPMPFWCGPLVLGTLVFCLAMNNPLGSALLSEIWPLVAVCILLLSLCVSYLAWERILPLRPMYPGILSGKVAIGLCLIPVFGLFWALRTWFCLGRYISLSKALIEEGETPGYHNNAAMLLGVAGAAVFAGGYLCAVEFANDFILYWHLAYVVAAYYCSRAAFAGWRFFFPTYLLPFTFFADISSPHDEQVLPVAGFYCIMVMTVRFSETVNGCIAEAKRAVDAAAAAAHA